MNWDAIGALGAMVGGLGVTITLVYLGNQVHEARRATEAQIYQARADAASRSLISFPIVHKWIEVKGRIGWADALASLSEEESFALRGYVADLMVRMDNSYYQYRSGLMDAEQLEVIKGAIRSRSDERKALGVDVEGMLVSRAFKDLVRGIDNEVAG